MLRDCADIIDHLCIAQLKAERIGTPETKKEFREFFEGLFTHMLIYPHIDWWKTINDILVIHRHIWDLESAVRQGKLDGDEMEVGYRAIQIRNYNKQRVLLKIELNKLVGEGTQEAKKDHIGCDTNL
jgi:hypothetical protein